MASKSPTNEPTTSPIVGVSTGRIARCSLGVRARWTWASRTVRCSRCRYAFVRTARSSLSPGTRAPTKAPDDAIVAGTLDIIFATPDPIQDGMVPARQRSLDADLKTGNDAHVAPIARNWQARVSALLGAKWTGAETVVPAIVYPTTNGGSWDVPTRRNAATKQETPIPFAAKDLEQIETDLRALHATVMEQSERVDAGKLPKLVTGTHCTYCAARAGCPALVSETRAIVSGHSGLMAGAH